MGLIRVLVSLRAALEGNGESYSADFLVDTGSTDTLVPGSELRRLGVRVIDRRRYELADGAVREYEIGLARVELLDGMTAGRIVFGPDDAEPLLGMVMLESLGFTVDPVTQTLKRLPLLPLKPLAA
jgi:clan AA aspartic protease